MTLNRIVTIIQELGYKVVDKRQRKFSKIISSIEILAIIILLYYLLQHFGVLNLLVPSMLADSKMSYGMLFVVGPLQSMQIIAFGSGNPFSGAIAMFMFGLAMISQWAGLSGIRVNNITTKSGVTNEPKNVLNMAKISESSDIQYVESNLDYGSYPEITVYSGIPLKWTINVPEEVINGCNYKIILSTYGITHEFTPGENVIEFTPGEPGTVQYICWMGMIYGKINIIESEGE